MGPSAGSSRCACVFNAQYAGGVASTSQQQFFGAVLAAKHYHWPPCLQKWCTTMYGNDDVDGDRVAIFLVKQAEVSAV